ncbi:hypothetical protein [Cohnella sp. GCM10012308]|uniref:hypothetical protein n=1 Tax=Cohnella sp. GCM10012308 TaxID=3317329 RepID=UPI00361DBF90
MKYVLSTLLLIIVMGITGCRVNDDNRKMTLTVGGESVDYVMYNPSESENGQDYRYKFAFQEEPLTHIKYIKMQDKITINFGNSSPDKVSVSDSLLHSNGEYIYPDDLSSVTPLPIEDGVSEYIFQKKPASSLSSQFDKSKKYFRGITIMASWGKQQKQYLFVIRTDA